VIAAATQRANVFFSPGRLLTELPIAMGCPPSLHWTDVGVVASVRVTHFWAWVPSWYALCERDGNLSRKVVTLVDVRGWLRKRIRCSW
jgi:hypothetical protein